MRNFYSVGKAVKYTILKQRKECQGHDVLDKRRLCFSVRETRKKSCRFQKECKTIGHFVRVLFFY